MCAWMNACSLCRAEQRFSKSQPSTPTLPPVGSGWTWFPAAACQHLPAGLSGAALTFTLRLGCVSATANEQKLWKARWPCPSGVSHPSWKCNFWVLSPDLWLSGLEASHFTSVPQQRRGASSACCFCWLFSDLSGKGAIYGGYCPRGLFAKHCACLRCHKKAV